MLKIRCNIEAQHLLRFTPCKVYAKHDGALKGFIVMRKLVLAGSILLASPALAENWATGDCITGNGTRIKYMVNGGQGFITYDNNGPHRMFTQKDGRLAIIIHVGNRGNMTMAVDLDTGRGYLITKHDDGRKVETNVSCQLSGITR